MKSAVIYGLSAQDGSTLHEVPLGTSPQAKALQKQTLAKFQPALQPLRAALGGSSLLQQRVHEVLNQPPQYNLYNLGGTQQPFTAYTPEDYYEPGHGGILAPIMPISPGHHQIDYYWTVPAVSGGNGLFANLVYFGQNPRQLIRDGIPQGEVSSNSVHFSIVHDLNSDGSGTTVASVDGVGEIYNGSYRSMTPWVKGYACGLYDLRMSFDGEEKVHESYVQQGLIFEHPFPTVGPDSPGDTTFTNSFGWSTDGVSIDPSLELETPRWSVGLSEGAALFDNPVHQGNTVSFNINSLKDTLTKNLQPYTTVPLKLSPSRKTFESTHNIDYYVFAHAAAVVDYRIRSHNSLPGYRAGIQILNPIQSPNPVAVGGRTVFSFDVIPINFENANIAELSLGLSEDSSGGYTFSAGADNATITEIPNGWHIEFPWTATQLPSLSGIFEIKVAEKNDPSRVASSSYSFEVGIDQRSTTVTIDSVTPSVVENQEPITVNATISSAGYISPSYNWKVYLTDQNNNLLLGPLPDNNGGNGPIVSQVIPTEGLNLADVTKINVVVNATTNELDPGGGGGGGGTGGPGGGTTGGTGGTGGGLSTSGTKSREVAVATNAELTIVDSLGQPVAREFAAPTAQQKSERNRLWRTVHPEQNSVHWQVKARELQFLGNSEPQSISAVVTSSVSNVSMNVILFKQSDNTYSTNSDFAGFLTAGNVSGNTTISFVNYPKADESTPAITYTATSVVLNGAEVSLGLDLATNSLIPKGTLIYPRLQKDPLGYLRELLSAYKDSDSTTSIALQKSTPVLNPNGPYDQNFVAAGYEKLRVRITDPKVSPTSQLEAWAKIEHSADIYCVNLHGEHDGQLKLGNQQFLYIANSNVNVSQKPSNWFFLACEVLDFRDFNGFFTSLHFSTPGPDRGYPPDSGLLFNYTFGGSAQVARREFGGMSWYQKTGWGNPASPVPSLKDPVLLGYNAPVGVNATAFVTNEYGNQLGNATIAGHDLRIIAWMRANRLAAQKNQFGDSWLCLNACAWDKRKQLYYYIPYKVPAGNFDPFSGGDPPPAIVATKLGGKQKDAIEEFGIWAVPVTSTALPSVDANTKAWEVPPSHKDFMELEK